MPFILAALIVVVALWILFTLGGSIIHLVLMLIIAGVVGWLADMLVPGHLPWGRLGAVLAGLVGSRVGLWLFSLAGLESIGPTLFGIPLIPSFVGAIVLALAFELIGGRSAKPRRA
jgi:uncharacterized membrane protein YeaQ/YmgE (transglycosylase-associated protein family)